MLEKRGMLIEMQGNQAFAILGPGCYVYIDESKYAAGTGSPMIIFSGPQEEIALGEYWSLEAAKDVVDMIANSYLQDYKCFTMPPFGLYRIEEEQDEA